MKEISKTDGRSQFEKNTIGVEMARNSIVVNRIRRAMDCKFVAKARLSLSKVNDLSAYSSDQSGDTPAVCPDDARECKCEARRKNEREDNAADRA